jgi:hypothetical protein
MTKPHLQLVIKHAAANVEYTSNRAQLPDGTAASTEITGDGD